MGSLRMAALTTHQPIIAPPHGRRVTRIGQVDQALLVAILAANLSPTPLTVRTIGCKSLRRSLSSPSDAWLYVAGSGPPGHFGPPPSNKRLKLRRNAMIAPTALAITVDAWPASWR